MGCLKSRDSPFLFYQFLKIVLKEIYLNIVLLWNNYLIINSKCQIN